MANERGLIYMTVDPSIKEDIGKIASVSGKSESEIFLQAIGKPHIDVETLKANLQKMKVSALAEYMGIDADALQTLLAQQKTTEKKDDAAPKKGNEHGHP